MSNNNNNNNNDIEKSTSSAVEPADTNNDEIETAREKRSCTLSLLTTFGLLTSFAAIGQAVSSKQSDGLIISNIVLTFVGAVSGFTRANCRRKGQDFSLRERLFGVCIVIFCNLGGIGVCIALLVRDGVSFSWILTLIFHVLITIAVAYFMCKKKKLLKNNNLI